MSLLLLVRIAQYVAKSSLKKTVSSKELSGSVEIIASPNGKLPSKAIVKKLKT